jgi:hypothetical protein
MAAGEAGTKVKSRQGGRLPNASESQILRELALARSKLQKNLRATFCPPV